MNVTARTAALCGLATGLLILAPPTHAQFAFTNLADNTGALQYFGPASINASGLATFFATQRAGGSSVFVGNGGALTPIATTGGTFSSVSNGNPRINDNGTVAFAGVLTTGDSGIFAGNGGALTTVVDTSGPLSAGFSDPDINNNGAVAFETSTDSGERGIFRVSGGTLTTIADTSGQFNGFFLPTLNDSGTVAFLGRFDNNVDQGIFTGSGGGLTTIADTSGQFSSFSVFNSPAISNNGAVAFYANLDAGGSGIFRNTGGVITTIADTNGPFSNFSEYLSINNSAVAFYANLDAGGSGIFTNSGSGNQKVIRTGDSLFGSTVTTLQIYTHAFNDAGQIGFFYDLADGREGVAIASPVPEASTLLGGLVGSLGGLFALRRHRNHQSPKGTVA